MIDETRSSCGVQVGPSPREPTFVDFDLECSAACPILPGQLQMWQNWRTWRKIKELRQQKIVCKVMAHPVLLCNSVHRATNQENTPHCMQVSTGPAESPDTANRAEEILKSNMLLDIMQVFTLVGWFILLVYY